MKQEKSQYGATFMNEEFDQLLDSICEIPYVISPFGQEQIICFDKGIEKLTGYSANDILADKQLWLNMIHPADSQRLFGAFDRCKSRGLAFEIEYRIIHKDGSMCWVIDEGEPVFNERGEVIQIDGLITDMSRFIKAWTRCFRIFPNYRIVPLRRETALPLSVCSLWKESD
jgi:PAS domain S-box-containing protein